MTEAGKLTNLKLEIMEMLKLPKELENKIIAKLKKDSPKVYWDYRDQLSQKQVEKILTKKDGLCNVEMELWELNRDHNSYDIEIEYLKSALEDYETELNDLDIDIEIDISELRDLFLDYLCIDLNLKQLVNNTGSIPIRIELYSNYDCINSHYFESDYGYGYMETYFGDIIDVLNLNPQLMKKTLISHGISVYGKWPNKANRNGKELVNYDKFITELINSCSGVNLFTFVATIDLSEVFEKGIPTKFTIPKGNNCGFFSSFQGGGSCFELPLLKNMVVDTKKKGKDGYCHLGLSVDAFNGYSITEVFGCSNDFFGNEIMF